MTREPVEKSSGLSLQTLLISSAAAVVAAVVVPMFWERGSLLATAITPIIVAIASEALKKPATAITAAAPKVARRSATGAALRSPQPTGVGARGDGPERVGRGGDRPPGWSGDADDPFGLRAPGPGRRRLPIRVAVITGLVAAVAGAAVVTASELALFGHSVGHANRTTSLFGGSTKKSKKTNDEATPTATGTATATPTAGATQTATPTATATATPTTAVPQTQQATPPPAATPTATP